MFLWSDFNFWSLPGICPPLQRHPGAARRTYDWCCCHNDFPHSISQFHRWWNRNLFT